MSERAFPVSIPVSVDEVPEAGLEVDFDAKPGENAAFAAYLDVPGVEAVTAHLNVARSGRALDVAGRVRARLVQTCVVTLEPMETGIDEPVAVRYVPGHPGHLEYSGEDAASGDDVDIEPLEHGRVDLGELVAQTLSLALDPYPRKPGVVFEAGETDDEAQKRGAFAELARLREAGGEGR